MAEEVIEDVVEEEKMIPQSQVNKLVGSARSAGAEKARKDAMLQAQQQEAPVNPSLNTGFGGMPAQVDEGKIADNVFERMQGQWDTQQKEQVLAQQQAEAEKLVQEYDAKLQDGRERITDFDQVVGQIDPKEFLDVVLMANSMDGTADIMYELAKNPKKLGDVSAMMNRSKSMARRMMGELGDSIKMNTDALAKKNASGVNNPLPRLSPSTAGADNGEPKTIADFKNASWLKG